MKDELKKLVEGAESRVTVATEGPWGLEDDGYGPIRLTGAPHVEFVDYDASDEHQLRAAYADAEFILHARADVPALCAAVCELDAENARLRAIFADLLKDWQGLVDESQVIGDGARDGVRICIKMLKKALPPTAP